MWIYNNQEKRNLTEQVLENMQRIAEHWEVDRVIGEFGIQVIGKMEVWEEPTGMTFAYGDAILVGTDGDFDIYIYTRGSILPDGNINPHWENIGKLNIAGPPGKDGEPGKDGKDGITPLFRISSATNYWQVSYDNGETWTSTFTKATGPQGPQGIPGESIIGPPGADGRPGSAVIIIDTLASLSELEDIDINNIHRNSAYIVPIPNPTDPEKIDYWLYFIVDNENDEREWDRTPFNEASVVMVNNQPVPIFNADTKIDKPTANPNYDRVAQVSNNSSNLSYRTLGTSTGACISGAVPIYNTAGRSESATISGVLVSGTPIYPRDVANKEYADTKVSKVGGAYKLYGRDANGNETGILWSYTAQPNRIPCWGYVNAEHPAVLTASDPVASNHVATKGYTDYYTPVPNGNANDYNTISKTGRYFLINGQNLPSPHSHGFLECQYFDGTGFDPDGAGSSRAEMKQTFRPYNQAREYYRYYNSQTSTWSSWSSTPLSSDDYTRIITTTRDYESFQQNYVYEITSLTGSTVNIATSTSSYDGKHIIVAGKNKGMYIDGQYYANEEPQSFKINVAGTVIVNKHYADTI